MDSFCGVPENLEGVERGGMRQWARGHVIGWRVDAAVPGFSVSATSDVIHTAFQLWTAVCGVQHSSGGVNVRIGVQRIDARNGVLAQAELPGVNQTQGSLGLWFDTSEVWTLASNPPTGMMDVLRVACHELGHSLGMGHAPAQSPNLMAPAVSQIRKPQAGWDIPQAMARYGEVGQPPKPPADEDDPLVVLIRELLGACPRGAVEAMSATAKDVLREWGR